MRSPTLQSIAPSENSVYRLGHVWKVLRITIYTAAALLFCGLQVRSAQAQTTLFYDDFSGTSINTVQWYLGENQWSTSNNGVVPQNLSLTSMTDPSTGNTISVLDAQAHGDNYTGTVSGVTKLNNGFETNNPLGYSMPGPYENGYIRTGGILVSRLRFGPAKYQVRLRNLPTVGGDSSIWNFYDPAYNAPGSGLYTEIDIEMPANGTDGDLTSAGLNSYATKAKTDPSVDDYVCNCHNTNPGNQSDGNFHLWEIDWYDGSDGSTPRVDWYFDGVLAYESTTHIPKDPAELWIGNWPAPWSYTGTWNYATNHQYIDYVSVTELAGDSYPTTASAAPSTLQLVAGSNTTADLAWQETADSTTLAGYNVYVNGTLAVQTPDTHIQLIGLTAGTAYVFTVASVNTAALISPQSSPVNYTTLTSAPACDADPTSPITDLSASGATPGKATLSWTAPVDGTKGGTLGGSACSIIGYEVSRSQGGTVVSASTATTYTDSNVQTTEYRYDITPYNQYGAGPSLPLFVDTTASCSADPAKPTGLTATVTGTNVLLSWTAPNAGGAGCTISSYVVKRNGTVIANATGTTYTDSGLATGTYSYTVAATNAFGTGTASTATNVTIPSSGNLLTNPGFETGSLSGWTCAGSAVANAASAESGSYGAQLTATTSTTAQCSQTVANLVAGSTHTFSAYIKSGTAGIYGYVGALGTTSPQSGSDPATWTLYSGTVQVPSSGSVTVYIQAYKQQSGQALFDNISFQ
jgi:hypothetical protein